MLVVFTKFIITVALAGLAACQNMGADTKAAAGSAAGGISEGSFTTSDGVKLHYREAGKGQPVVMIPGWSQTAAQFKHQLSGLSDKYRVIAIDMRGHGESDNPAYGYRIHRLSADVHEFLTAKGLSNVEIGRASCRERVCLAV